MEVEKKEKITTPLDEWITLFDPESHPGLSFAERQSLLVLQAKSVAQNCTESYPASTLPSVLEENPLYDVYDPRDDGESELNVQLICKVFFSKQGSRHIFSCVEYDIRL